MDKQLPLPGTKQSHRASLPCLTFLLQLPSAEVVALLVGLQSTASAALRSGEAETFPPEQQDTLQLIPVICGIQRSSSRGLAAAISGRRTKPYMHKLASLSPSRPDPSYLSIAEAPGIAQTVQCCQQHLVAGCSAAISLACNIIAHHTYPTRVVP